ncbi:MAG: hypothetical protein A2Y45_06320 [Tenericutes bacterium GWC2_34_14]|nr:MAG: hypothetical protein A2Z84_00710 [Tenericutes bacterium GWA2_35_7]OHE28569.1 MAG: hypothetical protein A2Y45_06320 [Tenericutes bacterium GWC2_34_14]OHE33523.1 MAG: hypothetical protein A2012_03490 [Tenericutes bacterium GWE2_34_108]OHE36808.1 MAG: hypothetical protein A2Y46_09290 [Tenericutes bacterium GWF1_35_14]OHE38112.1 MAG: hypothetical protein A2Y44_09375 [Tenericutes bacterium GWF2_35_184]OHE42134.1 MAG: hypothetical protein A3K26_07035 [Tenericutes bacterium RIFOXYA12_FULL_35_
MQKNSETRIQTEKNILEAFWELYKVKGFSHTTVKDVIKKAGYNRSTFYDYYVDLENVLEKIEESVIPSIDTMPPVESMNINIGMPIDQYVEYFKQHKDYYVVLLGENGDPRFVSKLKHSIKQSLYNHMPVKEIMESVQTEYILEYTLSGMIGILVYWLSNPDELSEYEIISLMKKIMPLIH